MQYLKFPNWVEMTYLLIAKDLKIRYKRNILGYFWALANPLAYTITYWMAFKVIMGVKIDNYIPYLITGMFPWAWINSSITQSCASYVNNASLLKRVRVPLFVIPLSIVLQELFHFLFAMPVIIGLLAFSEHHMNLKSLPIFLLLVILQFLIIFAFSQIGAICNAYVRDVNYLVNILFGLVFYATPIVYSTEMIPSKFIAFKYINPFYSAIESWHNLMLEDKVDYIIIYIEMFWVALLSFFSIYIYNKLSNEIRELV